MEEYSAITNDYSGETEEYSGETEEYSEITRTIETYTYQNKSLYFRGELIKEDDGSYYSLYGDAYELLNEGGRRFMGQLGLIFGTLRTRIVFFIKDNSDISFMSDMANGIIATLE